MSDTRVTFLGSGDSFGSGGRLPACVLVESGGRRMLLDCGPAVLPALRLAGAAPETVELIAVSHLHGDHFGGVAFVLLEAYFAHRRAPLVVAGPPSVEARVRESLRLLFPAFEPRRWPFELSFAVLAPGDAARFGPFEVTAIPVEHVPATEPSALRVRAGDRTIAYSGDAVWCAGLVEAARGSDLFICEASSFAEDNPAHVSYRTLAAHRQELAARAVLLVHVGADVLERRKELVFPVADDGTTLSP